VLLHVLDISHDNAQEQAETVRELLEELNVAGKPTVTALNKVDKLGATSDPASAAAELSLPTDYVPISAERGLGIEELLERIEAAVGEADGLARIDVCIPYERSELVNLFHRSGQVEQEAFEADGAHLSGLVPRRLRPRFEPFANGASVTNAPVTARTNAD
jgi:GTP-binding protein HflX